MRWQKDALAEYAESFPPVACCLEKNVDQCKYGHGKFVNFTYSEMFDLYCRHKEFVRDPQLGSAQEMQVAQEAYNSVRVWLAKPEHSIKSGDLKRFRKYIMKKWNDLFYVAHRLT